MISGIYYLIMVLELSPELRENKATPQPPSSISSPCTILYKTWICVDFGVWRDVLGHPRIGMNCCEHFPALSDGISSEGSSQLSSGDNSSVPARL